MCVKKHPLSLWEEQALLACFCFSSQAPSANIAAGFISCEETHHSPTTGSIHCSVFLPSAAGFAVSQLLLTTGHLGTWMVSTCPSPHPHPLPIPCCSLWSVLCSPLSFPLSLIRFPWRSKAPVVPFLHSLREGVSGMILGSPGLTLHSVPDVKLQGARSSVLSLCYSTPSQQQDIGLFFPFF